MVQAAPDAREPDGRAGRTIWEGTYFPSEGGGRGRERRKRESGVGKEGGEGEREGWEERERGERGWGRAEGEDGGKERLPGVCGLEGAPATPTPTALADRPSPLQTPRCGRRSTCGSGWSGR